MIFGIEMLGVSAVEFHSK